MRTPVIAGNWKMHKTVSEAEAFWKRLGMTQKPRGVDVIICAPYVTLPFLAAAAQGSGIGIGAQNVHWEREGAYTGEISAAMLKSLGVSHSIVGHSERRTDFGETDETVRLKAGALFQENITPIVCVGEHLSEREKGETPSVVKRQVTRAVDGLKPDDVKRLIIAYEPVWAIGTGKTASAAEANEVSRYIRRVIAEAFGPQVADEVRILYGGSVKPDNIASFMAQPDIDGGLIGGASLDADAFRSLVEAGSGS